MENSMVTIQSNIGEWAVDFEKNTITYVDDPSIVVPLAFRFCDQKGYEFRLDMEQKCLSKEKDAITVRVPLLVDASEQSRIAFVTAYQLQGIEIGGLTDQEAKKLQPAFKERMEIDAVTMDIAGKLYVIDYYKDAFVPVKGNHSEPIAFDDVKRFYDGKTDTCMFLIEPETHRVSSEVKPGLILVQTDHPFSLDPVRLGLTYDLDIYEKVMDHGPLKNHHKAKTMKVTTSDEQVMKNSNNRRRGRGI